MAFLTISGMVVLVMLMNDEFDICIDESVVQFFKLN